MAKKKTYAAVMDDMSKKLRTYQTRLQEAQQRGDTVGMQDYGRRIQRVQTGIETLFNTQEASKAPMQQQGMPQMRHGGIPSYGPGGPTYELGLRQHNPGNLRSWGNAPVENGFAKFNTLEEGYNALIKQLKTYQGLRSNASSTGITGSSTLAEAMAKYAPQHENDTEGYINRLVDYLNRSGENVTADTKISDIPTEKWASSIALVESPQAYAALEQSDLLQPDVKKALANDRAVVNNRNIAQSYQEEYPTAFPTASNTKPTQSGTEPDQGAAPEIPPFDPSVAALQPDTTALNPRDLNTPIPMLPETSATVSLPPAPFGPRTTSVPEPAVPPRAQQPNQAQINAQQRAQEIATSTGIPRGQSALERQIANNAAAQRAVQANQLPQVINPFEREYDVDERPGYAGMDTNYDPNAPLDNAFTQSNQSYFSPQELTSAPINRSPSTLTDEPVVSGRQQGAMEVEVPNEVATQRSAEDTTTTSPGMVTPEQRAQYEAAEAEVDAQRAAAKQAETDGLTSLFGQLVPEQNKFAQYAQFLPDLYAAYQMEQVGAPVDLPSQTMARMNTDVNYNSIYAQARQQQAEQNAMIDRNVSNPVVAAALKRSAANQAQATMGQTMASEIDQERQLSNQYAQSIAENKNLNAQITAQNQQQQIDFQNQKRAARAQMLQQAGTKLGQIYGEDQNRQAQIQQLGLSALQFEGDLLGRMGTNLEAMKAAGLIK